MYLLYFSAQWVSHHLRRDVIIMRLSLNYGHQQFEKNRDKFETEKSREFEIEKGDFIQKGL
jgi:hypothetical protein